MTAAGRDRFVACSILTLLMLSACATRPFGAPATPDRANQRPYLTHERLEQLAANVPAPSAEGSAEQLADQALSERYRTLEGSDRWLLATAHAELSPTLALQHFDCALGVRFASTPTPRLVAIFDKVFNDANAVAERAKMQVFRARPVGADPTRVACQRTDAAGRASASYPSGGAAIGAAYGDVIAAAAPENAQAAHEIGHQIAVSRALCGMHYPADAAAGEALGHAVFAEIAATPAFQADIAVARAEVAAVRAAGLTNPGCAAERAALAMDRP